MTRQITIAILLLGCSVCAHADIWKYVDAHGNTHFVDSDRPIFTWVDETGQSHYSNKPDGEDAVSVELTWVSAASLSRPSTMAASAGATNSDSADAALPGETEAERNAREQAEEYYCKRATAVYESYTGAQRLYKTNEAGEKEYLSDKEIKQTVAETKARVDEWCK